MKQKQQKRVIINKKTKQNKSTGKQSGTGTPSSSSSGFYYSFLTVILLLCLVQITISAVLNISKIVSYNSKIGSYTKTRDAAKALNKQLNDNIKDFSNVAGMEAIARNNLKMSSEDEVMVIINEPKDEPAKEKHKILGVIPID